MAIIIMKRSIFLFFAAVTFGIHVMAQQNVGIGTSSPGYTLDVNGRMRIRHNSISSGLWLNKSDNSEAAFVGLVNDSTAGFWGNGTTGNWQLGIDLRRGQLGIGTTTMTAPLTLNNALGNKMSIYSNANGTQYGIGLRVSLMQLYTDVVTSDIALGFGSSSSFTENVRFKGNGQVGIGTSTIASGERMEINGRLRLRRDIYSSGLWFNNSANSTSVNDGAFVGLSNETAGSETVGIWLNGAWRFGFERSGNLTISGLSGTGTRPVGATSSGKLVPITSGSSTAINIGKLANTLIPGDGSEYYLYLNNEILDPGGNYLLEPVNNLSYYRVPEDGVYHFTVTLRWEGNANGLRKFVFRDQTGLLLYGFEVYPPNSQTYYQQYSFDINLTAGTELNLYAAQTSGVSLNIFGLSGYFNSTFISGYKVY